MRILIAISLSLSLILPTTTQAQSNGSGQKIVIMDSGIATGDFFRNRVVDQWCWSRPSVLFNNDVTNSNSEARHYNIFSMCNNQAQSDFTTSTAAQIPRSAFHNIAPYYTNHVFGTNHGSTVLGKAAVTASGAKYIVINNTYYDSGRTSLDVNRQRKPCGFHGPNQSPMSIAGVQQPSSSIGCYSPNDAERQSQVIAKIFNTSNVAAINYSADAVASCNLNNSVFRTIKDRNIAFIASAGNGGAGKFIGYPACNPNVISVGAVTDDLNSVHPVTSLRGVKLDFLATGSAPNNIGSATSFAAPIVAAAFAIVQSAESRVRTVDEIKFALEYASPKCVSTPQGCVNVVTRVSAIAAAECIKNGTCRPNLPPGGGDGGVGVVDGGQYGSFFGDTETSSYDVDLPFSTLAGASANSETVGLPEFAEEIQTEIATQALSLALPPEKRDIIVKFTATMTDSLSTNNGIELLVNGSPLESTGLFNGEQEYIFVVPRGRFTRLSGNMISLRPIFSTPQSSNRLWGLSNISVQLTPIVELTVGQQDTARYGYSEDPERPSGMRVSFPLQAVTSDMVFTVTGWDIDQAGETEVFLNGKSQGFLSVTNNSSYGREDTFLFRRADLGLGDNLIEFVQRVPFLSGVALEQWAVKDLEVKVDSSGGTIVPIMLLLLDDVAPR